MVGSQVILLFVIVNSDLYQYLVPGTGRVDPLGPKILFPVHNSIRLFLLFG